MHWLAACWRVLNTRVSNNVIKLSHSVQYGREPLAFLKTLAFRGLRVGPSKKYIALTSLHGAFFCQKITAISRLLPLEFWCSEGHLARFDPILTLF